MDTQARSDLLSLITERFNQDELKTLSFDLSIDYEILAGENKLAKSRELILFCERTGKIPELLDKLRKERPLVTWPFEGGQARLPMYFNAWKGVPWREKLIGRDQLVASVIQQLEQKERVLLKGLDGFGKTAVAKTISRQWIDAGRDQVIWFETGNDSADTIIDRLISAFASDDSKKELGRLYGEAKHIRALDQILSRLDNILLILDDVWNGRAVDSVVRALPDDVPLLVTSPLRFHGFKEQPVGPLTPIHALDLLGREAGGRDYTTDDHARRLAESLGYHAYALKIAGRELALDEHMTPGTLLEEIESKPHTVEMRDIENGHLIVELLARNFDALAEPTRQVLLSFGALFTPGATSSLIASYLNDPDLALNKQLRELTRRSLLKRPDEAPFYEIHRLTYSYVKERCRLDGNDERRNVAAVQRYLQRLSQDVPLLALDQDNIFAALQLARESDIPAMVEGIFLMARDGYFDANGHTPQSLALLDEAIRIIADDPEADSLVLHFLYSKRGNEYINRGDVDNGVVCYQKAVELAPNDFRRALGLGVIGKNLTLNGSPDKARGYFEQALDAAAAAEGDLALGIVMQQKAHAAGHLKDIEAARRYAADSVRLTEPYAKDFPDVYGYSVLNMASAELDAAQAQVLSEHKKLLTFAKESKNLMLVASTHAALGLDYHASYTNRAAARKHLIEARRLFNNLGATAKEMEIDLIIKRFCYDV